MNKETGWAIALAIPITVWWAFVAATVWGWFIVPLGVPPIGKAHAWGLSIFAEMFLFSLKRNSADSPIQAVLQGAFVGLVCLSFGWIAHELM